MPAGDSAGPPSSRTDEAAAGWYESAPPFGGWVDALARRLRPKWDTLSWVTVRAVLDSANDLIAARAPTIVRDRRARHVAARRAAGAAADLVIDRTDLTSARFLLTGDPGEADASQYATIEPLLEIHRGGPPWARERKPPSDFMVVLSDVIYPAGDVNDYVNGFYIPYAGYDRPIYALPGNHDWYDGLDGFMFHFCRAEPLPRMHLSDRGGTLADRLFRGLWRRATRPDRDLLAPYLEQRPGPVQPGPYFAIELADLLIVAIDTGVLGEIDAEQGAWLRRISARPKPKLLLTGKPIWADGTYRPGEIVGSPTTVDDIVRDPAHGYVAAIGGDTHNYQRYSVPAGERRIEYIVSGGGGAYLSATHTIPTVGSAGPRGRFGEEDFRCYPLRGDSLALFCRRIGPVMVKLLAAALLVLAAAAGIVALAPLGEGERLAAVLAALAAPPALALPVVLVRRAGARTAVVAGALIAAGVVTALLAIDDARASVAMAVALATPPAAALALVASYAARGTLPGSAPDWLLIAPAAALPPALWAPYGTAVDALLYAVPPAIAVAAIPAVGLLRVDGDHVLHRVQRVLVAVLWTALAAVVLPGWMRWALAVVLVLIALLAFAVTRIGPGRHRTHPRREYTLGTPAAAVAGAALAGLVLSALPATEAAGVAAVAGALAAAGALYLLTVHRLADPRVLRHLRTGRISPAGAAEFVAGELGAAGPTRPGRPEPGDRAKHRMARVVYRIGGAVGYLADTNEPPFFKSFLSVEVARGRLELSCWGVTGYEDPERSPSLEDTVSIDLHPKRGSSPDIILWSGGEDLTAAFHPGTAPLCVVLAQEPAVERSVAVFAERGLGTFVFDHRRRLEDFRAAVAYVRSLGRDVALWGGATSAGHVLDVAAADPLIGAVVVESPPTVALLRTLRRLTCPLLVCVAAGDDRLALRFVERRGALRRYAELEHAAADQAEFVLKPDRRPGRAAPPGRG